MCVTFGKGMSRCGGPIVGLLRLCKLGKVYWVRRCCGKLCCEWICDERVYCDGRMCDGLMCHNVVPTY